MKCRFTLAGVSLLLSVSAALSAEPRHTVLVEAEGFDRLGGWVIDQQFSHRMGSPMLMAHGMGVPVDDAVTQVHFPGAGTYRVWVRTRDWVAPWKAPGQPGRFELLLDGKPLKTRFGIEGAEWHWQDGGLIEVTQRSHQISLHDLTGFNGRCDAIVFSAEPDFVPPNDIGKLNAFRKRQLHLPETPPDAGRFDLVVVGGGMAGTCAAISAARLGLDVALIQNRPVVGGNNSSEVRVCLGGKIHLPPYPALGGVVRELDPLHRGNARPAECYNDNKKLRVLQDERRLHLFLNTHAYDVETENHRIRAVIARNTRTNQELRFPAPLFADCTGDGTIGVLAGADYRYGRESRTQTEEALAVDQADRQTMGTSIMWYSVETDEPSPFPDCPWAIQFNESTYQRATSANWNWETGFLHDQVEEFEYVRDYGLRAVFGNWAYQKNYSEDKARYAKRRLAWVAYIGGKRESRRLLGDVILTQQDVVEQRPFDDASVTTSWSMDLHYPVVTEGFTEEPFRSEAKFLHVKPYAIPYRCLYSRNVENLFMAGRNISVTHVALGTIRVMRTTGMLGEVVGMAAAVARRHHTIPRGVYQQHLDELKALMTQGVGKLPLPKPIVVGPPRPPAWLATAGKNYARAARITVSGSRDPQRYPVSNINDGRLSYTDGNLRWISDDQAPFRIEFSWPQPVTLNAMRIVAGNPGRSGPVMPLGDFVLQYHDGTKWIDIPDTQTINNKDCDYDCRFPATTSNRFRLHVGYSMGTKARVWEIELYHLPGS